MFYKEMSKVYYHIFPAFKKAEFIDSFCDRDLKILDIACADGKMSKALSVKNHNVDAFDLSPISICLK